MSVRTEPRDLSQQLQQTLTIPGDVMLHATNQQVGAQPAMDGSAPSDHALAAANDFNTSSPEHPLKRTVVINIRSSLSDLCLRGARATWSPPSAEATKAIFQQAPSHRTFKHPPPPAPPLMKQVETNNTSTNENKQVRASVQLRGTWPLFKRTDSRFVAPVRSLQTLTRLVNRTV